MRVLLHVPLPRGSTRGNWITALRWARILEGLGHVVHVVDPSEFPRAMAHAHDALIALHARRSASQILQFRKACPSGKIIVALTGTDLNVDMQSGSVNVSTVNNSLRVADRILLLEPQGIKKLPGMAHKKCEVIYQSSHGNLPNATRQASKHEQGSFVISILAHLREVKDPFLIAKALELLPTSSTAKVIHAGEATEQKWSEKASSLSRKSSRYKWVGGLSHPEALELLATSDLTVLTSRHEGAPGVFSEAVAAGIPILSTRISAAVGILGPEHPGLFDVGNASQLAELIHRAENDAVFLQKLTTASVDLKSRLSPEAEKKAWERLFLDLTAAK